MTVWAWLVPLGTVGAQPFDGGLESPADAAADLTEGNSATPDAGSASETKPAEEPAPSGAAVSGASVAGQPRAHEAGGLRVAPDETQGWRWVPRVLFFPIRFTLKWIVVTPVEYGLYAYDRYQLGERLKNVFFNDEGTFGVYPVALFETGFGLNAGVRVVARDLFGEGARLRLRASYGGQYRQLYTARLSSGRLLGAGVALSLEGAAEVKPEEPFYGIGRAAPGRETYYSATTGWGQIELRLGGVEGFSFGTSLTLNGTTFGRPEDEAEDDDDDDDPALEDVFAGMLPPGYADGLYQLYGQVDLTWKRLRYAGPHISVAAPSSGVRVEAYLGGARGVGDDVSAYLRHGLDVSGYIDLFRGDRTLVLRGLVEGVSGERQDVPFVNLPTLGGPYLLRGHPRGRFRDRWLTLATAEYRYPVNERMLAALFVDTGSVWRELGEIGLDTLDELEVGFGVGVQLHSLQAFRGRVDLSFSPAGDVFVNLQFDPVTETLSRVEVK